MKAKPIRNAIKDGQAAGAWLAERASNVLLQEFNSRKVIRQTDAVQKLSSVTNLLRACLSTRVNEPAIAEALHALDGAIWDVVVEYEDRAWHAAWTTAINLRIK